MGLFRRHKDNATNTGRVGTPEHPAGIDHERCDRCGARAHVVVAVNGSHLAFCAHHYANNEVLLIAYPIIADTRAALHSVGEDRR